MQVLNGEKTESHLCETCAREQGDKMPGYIPPSFSVHDLLSGMMAQAAQPTEVRCETCGMSHTQFSKHGKFGCSDCYRYFEPKLDPLFRRVHGHTTHIGKLPRRAGAHLQKQRERDELNKQLQLHIARQEFEQAAAVRDRIKELGDA
jgi:protein arginine kinase activator